LYRLLALDGGNVALSPLSVTATLAMALAGARGDTAREIEAALRLAGKQGDIHATFAALLHDLAAEGVGEGPALTIANRIWAAADAPLEGPFLTLVRDHYHSEVGQEDFRDASRAARVINGWVDKATRGSIRDLVNQDDLSEETSLVLASAVYFLGAWAEPFDSSRSSMAPFWLDGSTSVPARMMSRSFDDILHASGNGWEAVELPYRGMRLVMDLIKPALEPAPRSDPFAWTRPMTQPPRLVQSLEELEASWSAASLTKMLARFRPKWVAVSLPKFEVDTSHELSGPLGQLGMNKAFRRGEADFSGAVRGKPTWIGFVKQRCRLRVDEQGTEAAAATVTGLIRGIPHRFVANHPFLFLVRDTLTGAILFMGRVADPTR
jgi:serpin B